MNKLFLLLTGVLIAVSAQAQTYRLAPTGSTAGFRIKNAGITVEGRFTQLDASATLDAQGLPTQLEAIAQTASLDTENRTRDGHLKGETYFDVAKYPVIRFVLTGVEQREGRAYAVGNLTIKKSTKTVRLPLTVGGTEAQRTLSTEFIVNRRDYGVGGWNLIMSDEATLRIVLALVPAGK